MYKALTIAGSDSGGGAGIQADLKTFSALKVYGACAITAVTAQNTLGVAAVHSLPADMAAAQIHAVMEDIGAHAAKTGMLANAGIIEAVAGQVEKHRIPSLVVDPVMVSKSGHQLLASDAIEALQTLLFPLASLVTPNILEAETLTGFAVRSLEDMERAGSEILKSGCSAVLVKGGHLPGDAVDVLCTAQGAEEFRAEKVEQQHTHGTGCTLSAAIAAHLAKGMDLRAAVWSSKEYLTTALAQGLAVGRGIGPVHHFHPWYKGEDLHV